VKGSHEVKIYKLYVDELGMSHPGSFVKSPYFILVGCIIDEQFQQDLENNANHIKFKYWGRTDIIFHSAEMSRNLGDFSIFEGKPELKEEFYNDIFNLLNSAQIVLTSALVDKKKAHESFWAEQTVISRSASIIMFNFLAFIYTKLPCRGKVIIEASSGYRDGQYLEAFNYLLSPNFVKKYDDFNDVREHLTSINFVTKKNHDIESQLADLFAYGVRCEYEAKIKKIIYEPNSYERRIVDIVEHKLMKAPSSMGAEKRKFYDKTQPITVIPKKISKPKEKRA
jgi:hypothetical protein